MFENKVKQAVRGLYLYNTLKRTPKHVEPIDAALNELSASDKALIFRFYINHKRKAVWNNHNIYSRRSMIYAEAREALDRYIKIYCRKE